MSRILSAATLAMRAVVVVGLGATTTAHAQQASPPFVTPPAGRMQFLGAAAAATTIHSGTIVVTLKITIKSAIPASQPILCSANVNASDAQYSSYGESADVAATRNGSAATCTMTVPYYWALGAGGGYTAGYYVLSTSSTGVTTRSSILTTIVATAFPANGTTTQLSFTVVL